jgi:hypothetical protein
MRKGLFVAVVFTSLAALLMLTSSFAMAQGKEQVLKVGKNGKIELSEETKVGDLTLKPGPYQVKHRVEGSDHLIHFIELTKPIPYGRGSGDAPKSHPGEVKCKLEPLNEKVAQTAVYMNKEDGTMRITKIVISGENVAHLF